MFVDNDLQQFRTILPFRFITLVLWNVRIQLISQIRKFINKRKSYKAAKIFKNKFFKLFIDVLKIFKASFVSAFLYPQYLLSCLHEL